MDAGIIGLGLLGSAVAARWLAAGKSVCGFDLDRARLDELAGAGGRPLASAREVFAAASRVALVLPTSAISGSVLEAVRPITPGTVVIDMTTGDPEEMARAGRELAAAEVFYLDATVSGSSKQARQGAAIVMASGDRSAFESCRDLWDGFAARTFYLGECGNGARMKLATNLVLGLNRAALAEGLAFALASGLPGETVLDVFRASAAYSKAMDAKGEKMLARDFRPDARLAQHRKDVDLILAAAGRSGAAIPFSRLHRELLLALEAAGFGSEDNSAILRAFLPAGGRNPAD